MPRICEFQGIVIYMYHDDHHPPHFHVTYGEHEAVITIDPLRLLEGALPPRVRRSVFDWATIHQVELSENWQRAREGRRLLRIAPLS